MPEGKTILQPGYIGGELSPRMAARVNLALRHFGAEKIENFLVTPAGDLMKRPGFRFVHPAREQGSPKLVPFVYELGDAYMLEFGNLYVRFYQTQAIVKDQHNITAATWSGGTATITAAGHHVKVGDRIDVAGVTPSGYNGTGLIATGVSGNDVDYAIADPGGVGTGFGTVDDPYTVTSPYATADLDGLQFSQLGNVLFIVAGATYYARKLTRSGATSWAFAEIDHRWGPLGPEGGAVGGTIDPAAASGANVAVVASEAAFDSAGTFGTDVGRDLALANGAPQKWGVGEIDEVTDGNNARFDIASYGGFQNHEATEDWRKGVFNFTDGANGDNPRVVALYDGRLWLGPSRQYPDGIWSSKQGEPGNFADHNKKTVAKPRHGLQLYIGGNRQVRLLWALSGPEALFLGTPTHIIALRAASKAETVELRQRTAAPYGAHTAAPAVAETELFYIQRSQRRIRRIGYNAEGDNYPSQDVMLLAAHIGQSALEELAFASEPFGVLWVRRADGALAALTHERRRGPGVEELVEAWSRHIVGGSFSGGDAVVESIATLPGDLGDDLWAVVKRTVDGNTVRYVEVMAKPHDPWDDRDACFYSDSHIDYDGAATATITGLDHLEGETLDICADGNTHPQKTVASGQITLDYTASRVIAGLPYQSNLLSYRVADAALEDNQLSQFGRIHHLTVELYDACGLRYYFEEVTPSATMDEEEFRDPDTDPEEAIPLFSGPRRLTLAGAWSREARIYLRHDYPQPCTILGHTTGWSLEPETVA